MLGRFVVMMLCVKVMAMGDVGVMRGLRVIAGFVVPSRLLVVRGGVPAMLGGVLVMIGGRMFAHRFCSIVGMKNRHAAFP
jgi:hypothetical protein